MWNKMLNVWDELKVPEILTREFVLKEHSPYLPWYDLKKKYQPMYTENPIRQSAFHLVVYLNGKTNELRTAYKILAYLKEQRKEHIFQDTLIKVMKKHNEAYSGWWHPNAKNVLPYAESLNDLLEKITVKDWEEVTIKSAKVWTELAQNWSIVIIPEYMDRDSHEFKEYQNCITKKYEEREYENYLRLKEKYEN